MNEIEKIQSLKAEIKEKHEKIKKSMILLVQMLGGEVEPVNCLLYTSPSPRDYAASRMPSSA